MQCLCLHQHLNFTKYCQVPQEKFEGIKVDSHRRERGPKGVYIYLQQRFKIPEAETSRSRKTTAQIRSDCLSSPSSDLQSKQPTGDSDRVVVVTQGPGAASICRRRLLAGRAGTQPGTGQERVVGTFAYH